MGRSDQHQPRHPLYIVSKGRADTRLTVLALDSMRVPYRVVIEEAEWDAYASVIDEKRLLVLDPAFQRTYDTCDDLGDTKSRGPGPARNFAWEHALSEGHTFHWVMDDNIYDFRRMNRNRQIIMRTGAFFRAQEDWVERYENVGMAGPNYYMFVPRKVAVAPFVMNTRIYSCNLIRNALPMRWRGRYNEDTDLSLRILKARWCTVQFNAFLQRKSPTQRIAGGNTAEFYESEGTLPKSRMIVDLHPDVSRLMWRFGRWHHYVEYRGFKQRLVRRKDIDWDAIEGTTNEYGMRLREGKGG